MHQPAIYPGLAGKTVFITGGGSGIGAAHTSAFAGQKAKVASSTSPRTKAGRWWSGSNPKPATRRCSSAATFRDIGALKAAIERVRGEFDDIGVLVNNAANDDRHKAEDVTVEYWDDRMAINLRPMFFATQAVAPQNGARAAARSSIPVRSPGW